MKRFTIYWLYKAILYVAILAGLVDVIWARLYESISIGVNPVFQTTLLFVILLTLVELHQKNSMSGLNKDT